MRLPMFMKAVLPRAAMLTLALSGPGAMASLVCTPIVGDVTVGATQQFRVANARKEAVPGTWSIGGVGEAGMWVDIEAGQLGTCIPGADGAMVYQAPELAEPTRALLRFQPEDEHESPILVPVRLWLKPVCLAAGPASASASAPPSPLRPDPGGAAASSPEVKPRKWKSYSPPRHQEMAANPGVQPQTATIAEEPAADVNAKAGDAPEAEEKESAPAPASGSSPIRQPAPASAASALGLPVMEVAFPAGHQGAEQPRQNSVISKHHHMRVTLAAENTLGEGSFAMVQEVEIENTKKNGIICKAAGKVWDKKVYSPKTEDGKAKCARMVEENKILIMLRGHDHVVSHLGFMEEKGHYFMITELAKKTLAKAIAESKAKKERMPEDKIKKYAEQILKGLVQVHLLDVVHGDLKGLNILLSFDDNIKIADFGSARRCGDGVKVFLNGSFDGCTLPWAAPEMLNRKDGFDRRADIWSYGCVLLEMASGHTPWCLDPKLRQIDALAHELTFGNAVPIIPADTSAPLRALIQRCLKREPADRPNAVDLLDDDYFKISTVEAH